jgi:DNA-binding transcriptional MerR regulator
LKLGELAKATGLSKETIEFYLRDGVLPKPRKRNGRMADYDESYVQRIRLIKELQERCHLPLSVIKQGLETRRRGASIEKQFLRMEQEFLSPVSQFLFRGVVGGDAFRKATGLSQKYQEKGEAWGIIEPEFREGRKWYSYEDVAVGKLMVQMGASGLGPREGFDPEVLKDCNDLLRGFIEQFNERFTDVYLDALTEEEFAELGEKGLNLMGLFFYFRYRKLARADTQNNVRRRKEGKSARTVSGKAHPEDESVR